MAIGMTACSKSDDTPTNSGDNNKLLGTWVGTAEVIAEKPAQQSKVSELFKKSYGALLGSPESNYQTYTVKVVFGNEKRLKITDKTGQYSFQEIKYSTLGNKIVDDEKKQPLATYSIENNRLLAENTDFFYLGNSPPAPPNGKGNETFASLPLVLSIRLQPYISLPDNV